MLRQLFYMVIWIGNLHDNTRRIGGILRSRSQKQMCEIGKIDLWINSSSKSMVKKIHNFIAKNRISKMFIRQLFDDEKR